MNKHLRRPAKEKDSEIHWEDLLRSKVELQAFDGDEIILSVESFTTPGVKYMVTADFRSGVVRCDCPDARCRAKMMDFTDGLGNSCKHERAATLVIRPFYEAALRGILKVSP